jgi:hypothetical protein
MLTGEGLLSQTPSAVSVALVHALGGKAVLVAAKLVLPRILGRAVGVAAAASGQPQATGLCEGVKPFRGKVLAACGAEQEILEIRVCGSCHCSVS